MSKGDFYNELKARREEELFQREFDDELARILAEKKAGKFEKNKFDSETMRELPDYVKPEPFTVENDGKFQTKKWNFLLKDCAWYYDNPQASDKKEIKNKLQRKYDSLFTDSWRFPVDSRRNLLIWACEQKNNYMTEKGSSAPLDE